MRSTLRTGRCPDVDPTPIRSRQLASGATAALGHDPSPATTSVEPSKCTANGTMATSLANGSDRRGARVLDQRRRAQVLAVVIGILTGLSLVFGPMLVRYVESGGLPPDFYDLQADLAFANGTSGLIYDVAATKQTSDCSYGVAYLLNGYTPNRYWYQVGLSWNWRGPGSERFAMNYNVFDPNGAVVDPATGGGGVMPFTGPVSPGDPVRLVLAPSNGTILMDAADLATGSVASASFPAFGQSSFGRGIWGEGRDTVFTGLMTECYRSAPGNASWVNVTYVSQAAAVPFGAFCVGEWNFSNGTYFRGGSAILPETCTQVLDLSSPQAQVYAVHGVHLWANETEFTSGVQG